MKVYHSSYAVVDMPDVLHSREALDFGRGFYVTVLRSQAIRYAERFKLRYGKAYLNTYELGDGWRGVNIKVFSAYDGEWLDFVAANRRMKPVPFYDAVEGGVANDKIFRTVELYFAGDIGRDEALRRLRYESPNHQICIRSQEVIDKWLKYIGAEEL